MNDRNFYVYILSNSTNVTVYVGVTNDLPRRVYEHKNSIDPKSFTARYHVHKLVYYEHTDSIEGAIAREKQIKTWNRARKNKLIEKSNPLWRDLYDDIRN